MRDGNTQVARSTSNLYFTSFDSIFCFFKLPLGHILEANPSFFTPLHLFDNFSHQLLCRFRLFSVNRLILWTRVTNSVFFYRRPGRRKKELLLKTKQHKTLRVKTLHRLHRSRRSIDSERRRSAATYPDLIGGDRLFGFLFLEKSEKQVV